MSAVDQPCPGVLDSYSQREYLGLSPPLPLGGTVLVRSSMRL